MQGRVGGDGRGSRVGYIEIVELLSTTCSMETGLIRSWWKVSELLVLKTPNPP